MNKFCSILRFIFANASLKVALGCAVFLGVASTGLAAAPFQALTYDVSAHDGKLPDGWRTVPASQNAGNPVSAFSDGTTRVLQIDSPAAGSMVTFNSPQYEFPPSGRLRLTVRARAKSGIGPLALLIIGDKYAHYEKITAPVGRNWENVSVTLPIPAKVKNNRDFWFRIDAGNGILIKEIQTSLESPDKPFSGKIWPLSGKDGTMPEGWTVEKNRLPDTGLTSDFRFEGKTPVLRMASGSKVSIMTSQRFPLPEKGSVLFTVWARATAAKSKMTLFIIGDKYRLTRRKEAVLTEKWQKITFEANVPAKIEHNRDFWFRIDAPAGGSDFLIGKIEADVQLPKVLPNQQGNLLKNGNFRFGANGFTDIQYPNMIRFRNPFPIFRDGSCIIQPVFCMFSDAISYRPGTVYSAVVRMRRAKPGVPATASLILLPPNYKGFCAKKFQLTDEFRNYRISGTLPPSRYNRMALRIDSVTNDVEIARAQLTEGDHREFLPLPELELGSVGNDMFDVGGKNAKFTLRVVQNVGPKARKLTVVVRNAFGKEVARREFNIPAVKNHTIALPVDVKRAGVFFVTLESGNVKAQTRYAVLYNQQGKDRPTNGFAWHLSPRHKSDPAPFLRYLPAQAKFNRFFVTPKLLADPEFQAYCRKFPARNVACVIWKLSADGFGAREENNLTPELEAKILEEIGKAAINASKCGFYGIELFNEPHLWTVRKGKNIGHKSMPPEKVAYLYKKARPIIKKRAPDLKVFGPITSNKVPEYNKKFLKAGGGNFIDGFSFHAYNEDPDLNQVAELNFELRKLVDSFRPGMPIYNTEVYYGLRKHDKFMSDEEARRAYTKDTELEQAAVYAALFANSVVSDTPFVAFAPEFLFCGVRGAKERRPLVSAAALNTGIEFLGNAGPEKVIFPIDDSLRCFLFPQAKGGAVATLRKPGAEAGKFATVTLPDTVKAFDLFGNQLSRKLKVGNELVYLRFAPGSDARKILSTLPFEGLGSPFQVQLTLQNVHALAVKICNRTARTQKLTITLAKLPKAWIPEKKTIETEFSGFEEKLVPFPMKAFPLNDAGTSEVLIALESGNFRQELVRKLNVFPVRYSKEFGFVPADYRFYGEKSLSPVFFGRPNRNADDCSAKIAALWNETGLMLSVRVSDDKFVPPATPENAYCDDSLQVYFDMKNDATAESVLRRKNRSDDLQYNIGLQKGKRPFAWLAFAEGTRYIGEANRTTGFDDAVRVKTKKLDGGGMQYNIFFPKRALYLVKFAPGSSFGFAVLVNDNDGKGRKQGITLTPAGTEPIDNEHLFMDMILLEQ